MSREEFNQGLCRWRSLPQVLQSDEIRLNTSLFGEDAWYETCLPSQHALINAGVNGNNVPILYGNLLAAITTRRISLDVISIAVFYSICGSRTTRRVTTAAAMSATSWSG
jgi:hypothetical protein